MALRLTEHIIGALKKMKNRPVPVLIGVAVIWLMFFDRDSVFYQLKINREIRQLEAENRELERKIDSTAKVLEKMKDKAFLERYAREELLLRKKNEDIYLIDTTAYEIR